jgi:hypothetical protein
LPIPPYPVGKRLLSRRDTAKHQQRPFVRTVMRCKRCARACHGVVRTALAPAVDVSPGVMASVFALESTDPLRACHMGKVITQHAPGDIAKERSARYTVRRSTVRERTQRAATLADTGWVREGEPAWMTMLSRHTALALALASLTRDESDRQPGEAYLSQQMHALGDILPFLHADTRHHCLSRSHRQRYRGRCIRMVEDGACHVCHTDAW